MSLGEVRKTPSSHLAYVLSIVVAVIALDQVTKTLAGIILRGQGRLSWAWDVWRWEYSENPGAFLSLGAWLDPQTRFWTLTVGTGVFLFGLLAFLIVRPPAERWGAFGLAAMTAGGLSNLADRVLRTDGRVVDFMNLGIGGLRTGIFNIADVAILGGVGIYLLATSQSASGAGSLAPKND